MGVQNKKELFQNKKLSHVIQAINSQNSQNSFECLLNKVEYIVWHISFINIGM